MIADYEKQISTAFDLIEKKLAEARAALEVGDVAAFRAASGAAADVLVKSRAIAFATSDGGGRGDDASVLASQLLEAVKAADVVPQDVAL